MGQSFYVTLVSRMMIFALAATGLNLVMGYGAMVSFGHALYIGIGAYAVGMLSFHGIGNGWVHLGVALGAGALLAAVIGLVCLRAKGVGFIMITLAFAQMYYFLAISLKQYGGDDGFSLAARSDFGFVDLNDNVVLYYLIFGLLMAVLFCFHRLVHARFGMVLRGCKSNERRMLALGFPTLQVKLAAYVLSALVCVLAGVLLANMTRFVSPSYMQWTVSGDLVVIVVLGGLGTLIGPLLGAVLWLWLEEAFASFHSGWGALDELVRNHWLGVLGVLAVLVALKLKDGIYGAIAARDKGRE
ncbi:MULTISPECIES: branched-chain amino acid ABC transporter permease [unclassified Variovorax]|uniref:branched-chain amino acid ABC transporter permease n=1 Tax=unclassified Variovorax TaxID=663243 RepID=UPI00210E58E8|nr:MULTISPECIES: branched-chain amino acid ABC transporter permease [unclassified Variovorax]